MSSRNTSQGSSGRGNRIFSTPDTSDEPPPPSTRIRDRGTRPPSPPIDYTVRFKPPVQRASTSQAWYPSPDDFPSTSVEKPPQIIPRPSRRKNTIVESEEVLDELDRVLDEEQKPKLPKQTPSAWQSPPASFVDDNQVRSSRAEENRRIMLQRSRSAVGYPREPPIIRPIPVPMPVLPVPRSRQQQIESAEPSPPRIAVPPPQVPVELKNVPFDFAYSNYELSASQRNKQTSRLYAMYLQVQKFIDDSRELYSTAYFKRQYLSSGLPAWKADILATRKAKETMDKIEEDAWNDFERWCYENAPNVRINAKYLQTTKTIF